MTAFLGLVFVVGCASAGDRTRTQVLDDGSRIEWNAAGNPVRATDTSGNVVGEKLTHTIAAR